MKTGSIVETVACFEELRATWGFPYPKKGDVLTVSFVEPHPHSSGLLLYFEELPNMIGLSSETYYGEPNFLELQLPLFVEKILNEETIEI